MELRHVTRAEMAEAVALADRTFRDGTQTSMGTAFPDLFQTDARQSFGAFDDGRLVAFMGLAPWELAIGPARLAVYAMGAVCTDPAYRGQGIASRLLELSIAHAEQAGASLLFVSGERSLYTRQGCAKFGQVARYRLNPGQPVAELAPDGAFRVREAQLADWPALHRLAERRPVRYVQSVSDLLRLVEAQAVFSIKRLTQRVLVAERDGAAAGYAVLGFPRPGGKGKPLAIEWAGEPDAVLAVFRAALEQGAPELLVPCAWHERALRERLAPALERTEANAGTVRVLSLPRLLAQLAPYGDAAGAAEPARLLQAERLADGAHVLRLGAQRTAALSAGQLAELLFAPDGVRQAGVPAALQEPLSALFPVPLPYTAGLNYI